MTQKLVRKCWWCNTQLMRISHAEIKDQLGNIVWVHKCCEKDAVGSIRKVTAQEKSVFNITNQEAS